MSRKERETVMIDPRMKEDILSVLNVGEEETFPRFVRIALNRELARRKGENVGQHAVLQCAPTVKTGRPIEDMLQEMEPPLVPKDDGRFGSLPPRGVNPPVVTKADIPPFLRRENREP